MQRRIFVGADRPLLRVDVAGGDEDVVRNGTLERGDGRAHLPGLAGNVDDRVPALSVDGVVRLGPGPIADYQRRS